MAVCLIIAGCSSSLSPQKLFQKLSPSRTGIDFKNELNYTRELNPYTYRNFYNGGGVGIGDFNNDGLQDIFFTGNQVSNKLYLNLGDFKFKDITRKAGLSSTGIWSTGVSVIDINGDGWLDIYVCKSGSPEGENRHNELFINNGNLTFTEKSKTYGLDVTGLSVDAHFFDYDRDGDLDMYLLNNSFAPVTSAFPQKGSRKVPNPEGDDFLFRNETISPEGISKGEPIFTDVTAEAGIFSSKVGFGLDVMTGDLNKDGWPDLYITNDFFERDYLYLNNGDGTFREVLPEKIPANSYSSMGGDIGDINHDGWPDIFVTDMLPESWQRVKSKTTFYFWDDYSHRIINGYHYQFIRNTLQLNRGYSPDKNIFFSEIGRLAGIEATDWSWSSLFADLNSDGHNDIFVTNGVYKDLTDQDYVNSAQNQQKLRLIIRKNKPVDILFEEIPSTPISNYAFMGSGGLTFKNQSEAWGLADPGFSNGAAYVDLDNDGDLDLVTNNVNQFAGIYKNNTDELKPDYNSLIIRLRGDTLNSYGIGTKIKAWVGDNLHYREQYPNRGFQSSVDPRIHIGLGTASTVDSLKVIWPDGGESFLKNVKGDQILTISKSKTSVIKNIQNPDSATHPLLKNVTGQVRLTYEHAENKYIDFRRNKMLFRMRSTNGPAACVADINDDGLDDLYLGGAKGQEGGIFIQKAGWVFEKLEVPDFTQDRASEDTDCVWFDADSDHDLDLYVTSGGSGFPASSSALSDRLYLNDAGNFENSSRNLPMSRYNTSSVVKAADFDSDGDIDLFTGAHFKPFAFGVSADGSLLINDGTGNFTNGTQKIAPALLDLGLITDAAWSDINHDSDLDLIIAGEWMPVSLFQNMLRETGSATFRNVTEKRELSQSSGWWHTIELIDLDGDGFEDIIAGNHGLNNRFKSFIDKSLTLWINDFDNNGSIEQIITYADGEKAVPLLLKQNLTDQMPSFSRIPSFQWYAKQSMDGLFQDSELKTSLKLKVSTLGSTVFWNQEGIGFLQASLPVSAQLSPIFAIQSFDESSANTRVMLGGNMGAVKPQMGRYMSSYGNVLISTPSRQLELLDIKQSGFFVKGEIRAILKVQTGDTPLLLVIRNNDNPVWFQQQ